MALLRLANAETTKLYLDEDKTEWVEVRTEIAKRERNQLIKSMPAREDVQETGLTPGEGVEFQSDLFDILCVGWSADFPCNRESYLSLPPEAADAIDEALATHFASMVPSQADAKKA